MDEVVVMLQYFRASTEAHFQPVTPRLRAAGVRTQFLDPRGIGDNPGALDELTLHDLAHDVIDAIEPVGAAVYLFATAYATIVARCVAMDRPDIIAGLLLTAPGAIGEPYRWQPEPDDMSAYSSIFFGGLSPHDRRDAINRVCYSAGSAVAADNDDYDVTAEQALALMTIVGNTPVEDYWSAGRARVLVIQGRDDRICRVENSRALRDELGARLQLVELDDVGHMVVQESPEATTKAVLGFLGDHCR